MDVRITYGKFKGQIRDIEPSTASEMLKDGRAERPCAEIEHAPAIEEAVASPAIEEVALTPGLTLQPVAPIVAAAHRPRPRASR